MHKFAIIGCGTTALPHAEQISRTGAIKAVCDIDTERAEQFSRKFEVPAYASIDALLKDAIEVDVVCLCTPTGYHAEHAIKSLQAGKHVVTESPLCLTTAGAWQIMETEKYCKRKIAVVNFIRHNSLLQELRKQVSENEWGRIKSFQFLYHVQRPDTYLQSWRGQLFPAGGMLYTELNQHFYLFSLLFGEIEKAEGTILNKRHQLIMEVEDEGSVKLKMKNGATGSIIWTMNHPEEKPRTVLSIVTENGTIHLDESYFKPDYARFYDHLEPVLAKEKSSQVFEAWKPVEAIEKIYASVSKNPT